MPDKEFVIRSISLPKELNEDVNQYLLKSYSGFSDLIRNLLRKELEKRKESLINNREEVR
jgi:metal-responsive CopG/Arc/MetJ family transcriptional regulator